jgi:hypothetical protein
MRILIQDLKRRRIGGGAVPPALQDRIALISRAYR